MKIKIISSILFLALLVFLIPIPKNQEQVGEDEGKTALTKEKGKKKTKEERALFSEARLLHEFNRQANPVTGTISKLDKQEEFQQARLAETKYTRQNSNDANISYSNRGPSNFGGRTRSLVIDRSDPTENTLIAGAVSGGVFRTTNGGESWDKVSSNDEIHSVTTIIQDPRVGFEDIWYYGSGESIGNSATLGSAYRGQGIWKSIDGGLNWEQMPSTASVQEEYDSPFDYITRIAIHPITGELYAAMIDEIARFDGDEWQTEIANPIPLANWPAMPDLVISDTGRVYASLPGQSDPSVEGIWSSPNGVGNWTRINDGFFIPQGRAVLALAPSNQNKLYTLFVNGNIANCTGPIQEADLWLWDQSNQTYTDYTSVLPYEGGCLAGNDPFSVQTGYDLCVAVKPDNENFVIIGGTNAYKKEDINDNSSRFSRIGGYQSSNDYVIYNQGTGVEHHPDLHHFIFSPQNNNVLYSASDGGVHRTDDVTATTVGWENLNNNYQTYQYYHVAIDPLSDSDAVIGGAQDNGTTAGGSFFNLPDETTHERFSGGDGVAVGFSRYQSDCYLFFGVQLGRVGRLTCDFDQFVEITPNGATSQFVTYYYSDPDNGNALYYAGNRTLYKTTESSNVTPATWVDMGSTNVDLGLPDTFQTFSTTRGSYDPASSFLLMGGSHGRIFKLNDPWNATNISASINITPPTASLLANTIVTGLAHHPTNKDIVLATYANYGIENIFLTQNATSSAPTWTLVERNLAPHSVRSAAIAEVDGETIYFVGTARGLYSTTDPLTEDWIREAPDQIGFALISSLAYRPSDNHLLIGTHGNGMYEAILGDPLGINEFNLSENISVYPNPTARDLNIQTSLNIELSNNYWIRNSLGQTISKGQLNNNKIDVSSLQSGLYFIQLEADSQSIVKRFIKK